MCSLYLSCRHTTLVCLVKLSVSQLAGEDSRDYLVRVERLSRDAGFDEADALGRRYCFVLAINGLRDIKLRMELMAKSGLTGKS